MLIYQNFLPFGLGGFVVFGPNPLPPKATLIRHAGVDVERADRRRLRSSSVVSLIDSGGVYGTMPDNVGCPMTPIRCYPGVDFLKPGTKISVYAPDGTFLYSFTTRDAPYSPMSRAEPTAPDRTT